jgi:tRNA-dihydrouridine synthase B
MRAGWSQDEKNAPRLARLAEEHGADLVTVHGRTRDEWYSGPVDLELIARIKSLISIPVLGNGGLTGFAAVREMVEKTNVDGVMIARGALGNPWIFPGLVSLARTGLIPEPVHLDEKRRVFFRHMEYLGDYYGEEKAVPLVRKFGVLYFKGVKDGTTFRRLLFEAKGFARIRSLVEEYCTQSARPGVPAIGS